MKQKYRVRVVLLAALTVISTLGLSSQPAAADNQFLTNQSFEEGGNGWKRRGSINFTTYKETENGLLGLKSNAGTRWGAFNKNGGVSLYQDVYLTGVNGLALKGSALISAQDVPATGQLCIWVLNRGRVHTQAKCTSYSVNKGKMKVVSIANAARPSGITRPGYTYRFEFYPDKGTTLVATTELDLALRG